MSLSSTFHSHPPPVLIMPQSTDNVTTSIAFHNLRVHGFSQQTDYQKTVASFCSSRFQYALNKIRNLPEARIDILKGVEGVVLPGEMLLVLGKPGAGCTTLLRTLAGQTHGLNVDQQSSFNYQGKHICRFPSIYILNMNRDSLRSHAWKAERQMYLSG